MSREAKDPIGTRRRAARARIAAELGQVGFALPGTVLVRSYACGKQSCRCHAEPPRLHGPYIQWTRKVDQKTVTRTLTQAQWERYRDWFDNAKRLRQLLAELEAISMEIFEQDPDSRRSPSRAKAAKTTPSPLIDESIDPSRRTRPAHP